MRYDAQHEELQGLQQDAILQRVSTHMQSHTTQHIARNVATFAHTQNVASLKHRVMYVVRMCAASAPGKL